VDQDNINCEAHNARDACSAVSYQQLIFKGQSPSEGEGTDDPPVAKIVEIPILRCTDI